MIKTLCTIRDLKRLLDSHEAKSNLQKIMTLKVVRQDMATKRRDIDGSNLRAREVPKKASIQKIIAFQTIDSELAVLSNSLAS